MSLPWIKILVSLSVVLFLSFFIRSNHKKHPFLSTIFLIFSIFLLFTSLSSLSELKLNNNQSPASKVINTTHFLSTIAKQYPTRFIKMDVIGNPLTRQDQPYSSHPWQCILDQKEKVIWEVKANPNKASSMISITDRVEDYAKNKYCGFSKWELSGASHIERLKLELEKGVDSSNNATKGDSHIDSRAESALFLEKDSRPITKQERHYQTPFAKYYSYPYHHKKKYKHFLIVDLNRWQSPCHGNCENGIGLQEYMSHDDRKIYYRGEWQHGLPHGYGRFFDDKDEAVFLDYLFDPKPYHFGFEKNAHDLKVMVADTTLFGVIFSYFKDGVVLDKWSLKLSNIYTESWITSTFNIIAAFFIIILFDLFFVIFLLFIISPTFRKDMSSDSNDKTEGTPTWVIIFAMAMLYSLVNIITWVNLITTDLLS